MTDLVERIERNRFVGREYLLWLWFESEVFETNLRPAGGSPIALWIEARLALSFEKDESVLKSAAPAASPEAKEALRQGKLPREAKLRLTNGEHEFAWVLRADTLAFASVSVPQELKDKGDEAHEVLYERTRLLEELEAIIEALWADFLTLRLSDAWESAIVPMMRRFAAGERVDEAAYLQAKKRVLAKKIRKG